MLFRSGYDHGHDEESQNHRDIKIDILDDYIRTPKVFRVISEKTEVPEGLPEPTGEVLGLSGPEGRERAAAQEVAPPLPWGVRIGLGGGAAPPPSFSSLPPFLDSYSYYLEGGNPTPGGGRTPPWRALLGRPHLPPPSFICEGRGASHDTQVDLRIIP